MLVWMKKANNVVPAEYIRLGKRFHMKKKTILDLDLKVIATH